jgi:hypothetical protein
VLGGAPGLFNYRATELWGMVARFQYEYRAVQAVTRQADGGYMALHNDRVMRHQFRGDRVVRHELL